MVSWSAKRRLTYFIIIFAALVILASASFFLLFERVPSCFDGIKNQDEEGIDCGGLCDRFCSSQVADLVVLWKRILPAGDGSYDVVARIENPNPNAGIGEIQYLFKLYDRDNILVAKREGKTFVNPNEQFAVLENKVQTGERIPSRVVFTFTETPYWVRADRGQERPLMVVSETRFETVNAKPRVRATIANKSLEEIQDIAMTALLFDDRSNVLAASKTTVGILVQNSSKQISFLFPQPLDNAPARIEILYHINTIGTR